MTHSASMNQNNASTCGAILEACGNELNALIAELSA
jgi:hypothetical protein